MDRNLFIETFFYNYYMKNIFLFLILFISLSPIAAQNITGRVVNEQSQAVEGASVVLQTPDSAFADVAITAADGTFEIS